mmetsp:Transcript_32321/g.74450  ORF Transcript_32321/g.74450 Transcript_32321/m.74450 type:complete len:152 (-) Transcript_32321:112-567(-)
MMQQAMSGLDPQMRNQMEALTSNPAVMQRMNQMLSDPSFTSQMERMMSDPNVMNQMMSVAGRGFPGVATPGDVIGGTGRMGGSTTGSSPVDPETVARVMANMSQFQTGRDQQQQQQQQSNSVMGNGTEGVENEMSEEEMIQEAIARSLREH